MATLAEIEAAWNGGEGDQDAVRALADAYVAANPAEFTEFEPLTIEQLVTAVDGKRAKRASPRANSASRSGCGITSSRRASVENTPLRLGTRHDLLTHRRGGR